MINYKEIYDAYWEHQRVIDNMVSKSAEKMASEIFSAYGGGSILDVGSGTGELVRALLRQGANAYGLDVSLNVIKHCNRYAPKRFIVGSALSLPFEDEAFETLISDDVLQHLAPEDIALAFSEMHRVCRRHLLIRVRTDQDRDWHRTVMSREWWETHAIAAGFRKHPYHYVANPFETLERDGRVIAILLEKISDAVLQSYPLLDLQRDRALHMDMSRESGGRSDAHMARYALAAEWVRPSDTVLDCACGLGYGSAMLAALSKGRRFIGVDLENDAVVYGRDNFGSSYGVEYLQGDAEKLPFLATASIDILVSFETLEHVPKFDQFLAEACRILKPDGRIIVSVPNRWEDDTGRDPNPYHFHVFDYKKAKEGLEKQGFIVEARYAQSAPGGFKLTMAPRTLQRRPLHLVDGEPDTEWWIVVASANPLAKSKAAYSHPDFERSNIEENYHVTDFAKYYGNPWIYRSLVQIGERLNDAQLLEQLSHQVMACSPSDSADYGATLTGMGYRVLLSRESSWQEVENIFNLINPYIEQESDNPHVLRWQISLAFLAALLAFKTGNREEAFRYFTFVTAIDPCSFSPLLSTKSIAAWFWLGTIHLTSGKANAARQCFISGIRVGRQALHASDENALGNPVDPLTFGFPELAEVADMAGQCVNALHYIDEYARAPGKFWRAVEIRRFGLVTWAMNLQKELEETSHAGQKFPELIEAINHDGSALTRLINYFFTKCFGIRLIRVRTLRRFQVIKK